jgi:hypothetical protein
VEDVMVMVAIIAVKATNKVESCEGCGLLLLPHG